MVKTPIYLYNQEMTNIRAIIFDVDQTLTEEISWYKLTKLLGANPERHLEIFHKFQTGELTYPVAKKQLLDLWFATGNANVFKMRAIFKGFEFSPGTTEIIKYLQAKDYKLCLISGSLDLYIEIVAQRLKITDWFGATKVYFEAGGNLTDFDYKLSNGEEKVGYLKNFCKKYDLKPEECAAVGDGSSDMPLFAEVGLPILLPNKDTLAKHKLKITTHINDLLELKKYF
jgi:phosphoserine phosphatase